MLTATWHFTIIIVIIIFSFCKLFLIENFIKWQRWVLSSNDIMLCSKIKEKEKNFHQMPAIKNK
jgi:hypothetical protein